MTEHLTNEFLALRRQLDRIERKITPPVTGGDIGEQWLTGEQVQELLNIRPRTLQKYRDQRLIGYSQVGSKIYYRATDVQDHLQRHFIPPKTTKR